MALNPADHEAVIAAYRASYAGYQAVRLAVGQKAVCVVLISDPEDSESDAFAILRVAAIPVLALKAVSETGTVFSGTIARQCMWAQSQ